MRRLVLAGLCLAATPLLSFAQAGASTSQPTDKVRHTATPVLTLAMDGPRVAYMLSGRVVGVWNVKTGTALWVKGKYPSKGSRFGNDGPAEVAIAGKRLAFITRFVIGNSQQTQERLYTAQLGGSARQVGKLTNHSTDPQCFACGDPGFSYGDWVAGVVGSGKTLVVSTWRSDKSVPTHQRLSLVTSTGLRPIVTGQGTAVAESADGGHVAVLRSTVAWPGDDVGPTTAAPTVGIYSTAGKRLSVIVPGSGAQEVALSGNRLVVLTKTVPQPGEVKSTLEVYDWTTGTLLQTRPVAVTASWGGIFHVALYGRLAVVEEAHTLHLLDLTTGKDVLISATGSGGRDAAIGPLGLVYADDAYATPIGAKLVFVPMSKLIAMVS